MTTVLPGHTLNVGAGQTSSGVIVDAGGTLNVLSGGTVSSTIDSGLVNVSSGGQAVGTKVASGGTLLIFSGGLADPTTILGHGIEIIHSGGVDSGALIKGGTQFDSGLASSATVFTGSQVVVSGGTANEYDDQRRRHADRCVRWLDAGCVCQARRQAGRLRHGRACVCPFRR